MADIKPDLSGEAASWTPRQALMAALAECDDWSAVVIIAQRVSDGKPHGFNSAPNAIVRSGLCAYALVNSWGEDDG